MPENTDVTVEHVTSVQRFIEIELDWDELYKSDPYSNIYLSSRFFASLVLRAQGKFRILLAWSNEKRCVGVFPLLLKTRWNKDKGCFYNELDMLGHVFDADYTGFLCDPGLEASVCEAFANEISRMSFARLTLSFFSGPASRLEQFQKAFGTAVFETSVLERKINSGETNNLICPYVDLPESFDRYLEQLSSNSRQKIRRLLRRLDADPDLRITRSRSETHEQDAAILSELWFLQYAERKGQKRAAKLAGQFKEVVGAGLANGLVYLAVLWRGRRPVAAQANYVDPVRGHTLFHVGARDETITDLPIGLMLQAHCIRWSIAQGFRRYDFTLGDETYKYSFGAVDREIACIEIATRSGMNATGRLDESARDDVAELIRRYASRERSDDARVAAGQALEVWPDLPEARGVEPLINQYQRT
ncbi:MAG: GNAT family N-acetyltransferase [Pseudomonadota bacterium]